MSCDCEEIPRAHANAGSHCAVDHRSSSWGGNGRSSATSGVTRIVCPGQDPISVASSFCSLALRFALAKLGQGQAAQHSKWLDWRDWRTLLADAATEFEKAAQAPGLFGTQAAALDLAVLSFTTAGFGAPGEPVRPEYSKRAAKLVWLRL